MPAASAALPMKAPRVTPARSAASATAPAGSISRRSAARSTQGSTTNPVAATSASIAAAGRPPASTGSAAGVSPAIDRIQAAWRASTDTMPAVVARAPGLRFAAWPL